MKRAIVVFCCAIALAWGAMPLQAANAEELYRPNVAEEMDHASYWIERQGASSRVLADGALIAETNQLVHNEAGAVAHDLESWPEETFDGIAYAQELKDSALADAEMFYSWGAKYDAAGTAYESWDDAYEAIYKEMVENCANEEASTEDSVQFGMCTSRTNVLSLPGSQPLWDDAVDPSFDYLLMGSLRMNEPVVVQGLSNDGRYYHVATSTGWGWAPVSDIALCASKAEWLDAWNFSDAETLVVYADTTTENESSVPKTANLRVPMGTCLKLAVDDLEGAQQTAGESDRDSHVVWVPLRNDDGSYACDLARLPRQCEASHGFMPLTAQNISKLAFNGLLGSAPTGDVHLYGDCSALIRDVYGCFGLELANNTVQLGKMAVTQYGVEGMDDEQKAEFIQGLPLGSVLNMGGHELLYLGDVDGHLYVISALGSMAKDGGMTIEHGCAVNSLDAQRANGDSWLRSIDMVSIPFYPDGYVPPIISYACTLGDASVWGKGDDALSFAFDCVSGGEAVALDHLQGLAVDGQAVDSSCYTKDTQNNVVALTSAFLDTLSYGSHTLVASFDDGDDASASFVVEDRATEEPAAEDVAPHKEEPSLHVSSSDEDDDWDDEEDDDWDDEDDDWDDEDDDDWDDEDDGEDDFDDEDDDDWDDEDDDDWDDEDDEDDDWDDEDNATSSGTALSSSGLAYPKLTRTEPQTSTGAVSDFGTSTNAVSSSTPQTLVQTADATNLSLPVVCSIVSVAVLAVALHLRLRS
ncbi:MAG: SH3 domain-containing protein [Atopobiaceae bacterium]|nr:SH3 domain-containing protein [Atopobiaceae bacterium]